MDVMHDWHESLLHESLLIELFIKEHWRNWENYMAWGSLARTFLLKKSVSETANPSRFPHYDTGNQLIPKQFHLKRATPAVVRGSHLADCAVRPARSSHEFLNRRNTRIGGGGYPQKIRGVKISENFGWRNQLFSMEAIFRSGGHDARVT